MSYQIPSQETKDYELRKQINTLRNISLFQNSGINVDSSGVGIGSRDTPTSVARGTSTFDSVIHTLSQDASNLYHATIQAGNVIIKDVTQGANIALHYIDQVGNSIYNTITQGINGMWAFVKGVAGKVLTLVKATDTTGNTGNFYLDNNISLNENQQVIMKWDATLGSKGMWVVAGGTPTLGANTALSNLTSTSINQSLVPNADNTFNLGTNSNRWASIRTLLMEATSTQFIQFIVSGGNSGTINYFAPVTHSFVVNNVYQFGVQSDGSHFPRAVHFDQQSGGIQSLIDIINTNGLIIGTNPFQLISFFGNTPIVQGTITGSRGGNVALKNLLTYLNNLGLILDNTTP